MKLQLRKNLKLWYENLQHITERNGGPKIRGKANPNAHNLS